MAVPVLGILFAKGAKTEIKGARLAINVDAFITRSASLSSSVTRAPVEDGSNINDHVILDAVELTLEGLTSDHPVDLLAGNVAALAGVATDILGDAAGAFGLGGDSRSFKAREALEEAWREKTRLEIVTRLRVYKDMVIEQLEWNESADVGEALAFRMRLIEIRTVKLQTVASTGFGALDAVDSILADGVVDEPVEAGRQAPKQKPAATKPAVTSLSEAASMSQADASGAEVLSSQ